MSASRDPARAHRPLHRSQHSGDGGRLTKTMKFTHALACLVTAAAFTAPLRADNARFDLAGPKISVKVTRGATTLPIAQVPNLQPGDKLWVKADLPDDQRNHLLLIVAFLRGTTNEPPDSWFTEIDTWDKKRTAEGTTVTVPQDAQQALLFVAPETGGDFKTLRSAVKGKPGLFIRADADLNEASFEQQRIERYLAAMKTVPQDDQKAIKDHSAKLAATLALKPNADCFKQPVEAQVNCLTQSSNPVLLSDGHGQTIAESLSSGASSDFINAASYTGAAGGGVYSAYVGAVVDLVHLVSTLHTAKYQYIPGLSFPQNATLDLKLNAPVSFVDPKSVIVIGLPAIQKAVPPPLHAHDPEEVACLLQPHMALELEGAPLVFSTSFAHDLVLHVNRTTGAQDLALTPDAFEGGLVVSKADVRKPLQDPAGSHASESKDGSKPASPSDLTVTGTVHGYWGFDHFDGPTVTLQQVEGKGWKIVSDTQLLAGQDNHLTLEGDGTACVEHVALVAQGNKDVDVSFKAAKGDGKPATRTLALDVPLKTVQPGGYSLLIQQYGQTSKDKVALTAYTGDIHLTGLKMHSGDDLAVLTGQGLANVAEARIGDVVFTPKPGENTGYSLELGAKTGVSPQDGAEAAVKLKDGRTMNVKVSTEAARPSLQLASMTVTPAPPSGSLPVNLEGKDEIPLDGKVTFVVQTREAFPRDQKIEVATADGAVHTTLSLAENHLVLQDQHTALATLEPLKAFGQSAFGKLQMRPVAADGTTGAWTPLGNLVRTPQISAVQCTSASAPTCTLKGSNLFLVQSFDASKDFTKPTEVPSGFAQNDLPVPTPADGATLYLKLRDDPAALASITLPQPIAKPAPASSGSTKPPSAEAPASGASAGQAPSASNAAPAGAGAAASQTAPSAPQPGPPQ